MEKEANPQSLCEQLEIALYCTEELSGSLKLHLESCPHCKQLLDENKRLTSALSGTNLTSIGDGEVADAVMKKLSLAKKKKSGFSFSHHMGTAAAIVIICAAALYVKHFPTAQDTLPSSLGNEEALKSDVENSSPIIESTHFAALYTADENETEESVIMELSDIEEDRMAFDKKSEESYEDTDGIASSHKTVAFKSARPQANQGDGTEQAQSASSEDDAVYHRDAPLGNLFLTVESHEAEDADSSSPSSAISENGASESDDSLSVYFEEAAPDNLNAVMESINESTEEIILEYDTYDAPISSGGGSGGGSGGSGGSGSSGSSGGSGGGSSLRGEYDGSANEAVNSENSEEDYVYSNDFMVFGDMEFFPGDENLDLNISLANSRLGELYGDGKFIITRYALENNGYNGNEFFFTLAPSLTYSHLIGIQASSAPICE